MSGLGRHSHGDVHELVAGALGGIVVPLAFDKLKFDPAVASGPFVTTITDVVGYGGVLTIASMWFHLG